MIEGEVVEIDGREEEEHATDMNKSRKRRGGKEFSSTDPKQKRAESNPLSRFTFPSSSPKVNMTTLTQYIYIFWSLQVTPRQSPSQATHHPPRQPSTSSSGVLEGAPGRSKKASIANLIDSDISGDEGEEDPTVERDL